MLFTLFELNSSTKILFGITIMLLAAFTVTRITKILKLPYVTGYIAAGILLGPYVLNFIPHEAVSQMDFVTDIALAFIAFSVGRYLKISYFRQNRLSVIIIALCETLITGILVSLAMIFIFNLPVPFAFLIGAIGAATAPTSTIMTIRQYKAKGRFVNTLLQVIALDNAIALITFSICAAIAGAVFSESSMDFSLVIMPVILNLTAIAFGVLLGFVLNKLINGKRSDDNKLIVTVAVLLAMAGLCSAFNLSPLLACMAIGATYINLSNNKGLFKLMSNFAPPFLNIFFVISGMRLNVPSILTAGAVGIAYFVFRLLGKAIGSYTGATIRKEPSEIKKYFSMALIPQASVAIGLALLGQRVLPDDLGSMLITIILSSSVIYEIIGPVAAKASLSLTNSIPPSNGGNITNFEVVATEGLKDVNCVNLTKENCQYECIDPETGFEDVV